MTARYNVAVLVGSLRKASFNRRMANALIGLAPPSLALAIVEIDKLPLFDEDWEAGPPDAVREFRQRIADADAVLFVTAEYNRGVPGVLKNAIDIGSRPAGKSAWRHKAGAVISVSPGKYGGFGANHHLRQSMVSLDVPMMQQPEAYIAGAASLFDASGALVDADAQALARKFIEAYARWVERIVPR
jgi:chromate reductase